MGIALDIVTPEAQVSSQEVFMASIPGEEGDFGVLEGHAPLISAIKPGVIALHDKDINTISSKIFVAGGFAEVTGERCTILATEAISLSDVSKSDADARLKAAEKAKADANGDYATQVANQNIAIAQALVNAL